MTRVALKTTPNFPIRISYSPFKLFNDSPPSSLFSAKKLSDNVPLHDLTNPKPLNTETLSIKPIMGSKLLTQSLLSIPRPIFPNSSNNLAFSTVFPSRPCSFNSTPITISRALSTNSHSPIFSRQTKRPLVVRAEEGEAEPEPAAEETPENAEAGEESETVALAVAEEEAKPPRKPIVKLGDIMGILNKRAVEASEKERPVPDLRTGDIVEIKLEVPENRRRASTYKGIVISKQNAGIHTTIRIRRIIAGIGVEIVFPVYSPNIKEIKVVKHRKVRRARLYYLRDKLPRFSTFK